MTTPAPKPDLLIDLIVAARMYRRASKTAQQSKKPEDEGYKNYCLEKLDDAIDAIDAIDALPEQD